MKSASTQSARASSGSMLAAARAAAYVRPEPEQAFHHFHPLAVAVPREGLALFTGVPLLMLGNIRVALAAMESHWETVAERMTAPAFQSVFELPSLTLGLEFATQRVPSQKLSTGEIESMLGEGTDLRELTLSYLEIVSHPRLNLVPRERVRAVREGKGKLDKAQDYVAIPGIFNEFASALAGKHPFAPESLTHLASLGNALVHRLRPGMLAADAPVRGPEAILRDQFAVLVLERFDTLLTMASVSMGPRRAALEIPALRAAVATTTTEATAAAQTPVAAVNSPAK